MSWWTRTNDRMAARELRESWPRALARIVGVAVVVGIFGGLLAMALGRSWVFGAVLCGSLSVTSALLVRGLVLLDIGSAARRR